MAPSLPRLATGELVASSSTVGVSLVLQLEGQADANAAGPLTSFFNQLHDAAVRLEVAQVLVDSRNFVFMTSSCFKAFLAWVAAIEAMPAAQRYGIRLSPSPKHHWQRRSFAALGGLAQGIVSVAG